MWPSESFFTLFGPLDWKTVHPEPAVSFHAEKTLWFSAGLASKIWSDLFSVMSFSLPTSPIHTNKQLIIIGRARVCVCVQCTRQSMPNLSDAAFVQSSGKKTKEVISIFSLNNADSLIRRWQMVYEHCLWQTLPNHSLSENKNTCCAQVSRLSSTSKGWAELISTPQPVPLPTVTA